MMPPIALLGTGLLGEASVAACWSEGCLKVLNRSADNCEPLLAQGAVLIDNLA